ncbi:SigE family RNA polymerase sigma factor [Nocardioides sp.]|uniref:SigE family RNA polymerase sigma factor n=1 Tax=Nocardioides sp. TaxID=35761 RepID=UPI002CC6A2CE|nr:SigE family RNA polymerase sigma factor [Nocardioides sp.]HVX53969.1 SigE family RNA polymerase sigma factor [Nocardioides sp.]
MVKETTEVGMRGFRSRGDATADFEHWVAVRYPALRRTAYLLCGGDPHAADDLTQTTLAKLYLSWGKVRDHDRIDAYVRRIMLNEHRSSWRRAFRHHEVPAEHLPDHPAPGDAGLDGERDAVWAFVQTLPPKQRAVIVLRYYEDLSEIEIAAALGISPGTVKSQASRALAALRQRLPEHPEIDRPEHDWREAR